MTTSLTLPNAASAPGDPSAEAPAVDTPLDWLQSLESAPAPRKARLWGAGLIALLVLILAAGTGFAVWRADEPIVSATLSAPAAQGGRALFRTRLEPRRRHVIVTPLTEVGAKDRRHARQLWMMRSYGPPVSLGLIDPGRTTVVPVDPALMAKENPPTHLFVTRERPGGSKRDFPQGPTVAEAALP